MAIESITVSRAQKIAPASPVPMFILLIMHYMIQFNMLWQKNQRRILHFVGYNTGKHKRAAAFATAPYFLFINPDSSLQIPVCGNLHPIR